MSHHDSEVRCKIGSVETRADGESMTIAGYAAVFNERAEIGDYFVEVISAGAFADSIAKDDVMAYFGHDRNRVLGRKSSKTLRMREDAKGLFVEIDLPNTTDGRDARELIARGDIKGMSIRMHVTKQVWDETQDPPLRTIQALDLGEVSIVSEPAYEGTTVALRSREAARAKHDNFNAKRLARRMKADLDLKVRQKA